MPVFSGSAVTQSEASRFIRANLPELGDSPAVLAQKSQNRQMITNAAARIVGAPEPFPGVPSWMAGRDPAAPPAPAHGQQGMTEQQARLLGTIQGQGAAITLSGLTHGGQPAPRIPHGYRVISTE